MTLRDGKVREEITLDRLVIPMIKVDPETDKMIDDYFAKQPPMKTRKLFKMDVRDDTPTVKIMKKYF